MPGKVTDPAQTRPDGTERSLPRVALIGVSGYANDYRAWVEAAMDRQLIDLVAVVVINRPQVEDVCARLEARGVRIYEDWRAMLDAWRGRLDLCLAPVPIHLHAEIAIEAMEAGANVLIEKPLAASAEQARRISATELKTGRWVAVGYQDCYSAATHEIADQLGSGRIGRVRSIRWLGLWPRPESYYQRNQWAGRVHVGDQLVRDSPLNNAMAHYLNLAFYWAWMGSGVVPEPIQTEAELFRSYPIESFDTAVMRLHTSSDVTIHAAVSHCCPADRPIFLRIIGDKGELQWTHQQNAVWLSDGVETGRLSVAARLEAMAAMFDAVLARIKSPQARICTSALAQFQVRAIESLPSEIRTIEPRFATKVTKDGASRLVIETIDSDLALCMEKEALPSELGIAWAAAGSPATRERPRRSFPATTVV